MLNTNQKIHFIGVGGSGMSGIAEILCKLGKEVSGSDTKKGEATTRLETLGVHVNFTHESKNVHGKDLLVVSSAIQTNNPELLEAKNLGIPIVHRTDMLAGLMQSKKNIIVAGTHGKTTTSSLLAHVLHHMGLDPTAVIGGRVSSFESNAKFGQGAFFVAEADESDGSFLRLQPHIAIITNIDRDHLEYYGTLEEIFKAFESFVSKVPQNGAVCICTDDPVAAQLASQITGRTITYGLNSNANITARNIRTNGFRTTFSPVIYGQELSDVVLNLPGHYNVSNALASFAIAYAFNLDMTAVGNALSVFEGTLHRYTLIANIGNHLIVDDYAHNPKKVETVLNGTRESFPEKKIVAVFQPHRYTRVKEQGDEFAKSFYNADTVIITPIYSAGEQPIDDATVEILANKIASQSFAGSQDRVKLAQDFAHTAKLCQDVLNTEGTIFLTLGAGDVAKAGVLLKEELERAHQRKNFDYAN